jgi:hypothetical protein
MSNTVQGPKHPCRATVVELAEIKDPVRGTLGIAETPTHVPFAIRRVLTHYDLPLNDRRGNHAHRELEEFIICIKGSIEVELCDAQGMQTFYLETPRKGVYVPPLTWITVTVTALETICVVMTSANYEPDEYIHDAAEFEALLTQSQESGD